LEALFGRRRNSTRIRAFAKPFHGEFLLVFLLNSKSIRVLFYRGIVLRRLFGQSRLELRVGKGRRLGRR